ncbi:MAG TPA: PP2C family protein-serine/threonine phosphatase [Terriglobales bacterium]|nr:PP2C family protein-serine/threonine phosphatase [Terriglobales bacterium]
MGSSSTRRELENETPWSWREWMGANAAPVRTARSGTSNEKSSAFQPEEAGALYREVFDALQVPRRLSGPRRVRRGPFEIVSEVFPAQFFSGDFVSVFDSAESTFLALGDIAGKGLTAAMWSTHILGLIRTYSASLNEPGSVLGSINRDLYLLGSVPFTTMVLARLHWRDAQLTYANAGHCAPIVHRLNSRVEELSVGGPVLGAVHDAEFEQAAIEFAPGATLVSYSDGLVECRNEADEEFGVDRLVNQIRSAAPLGASKALFSIVGAVQDFGGGTPRRDDISLLVVSG